jgi:hypothetical protein
MRHQVSKIHSHYEFSVEMLYGRLEIRKQEDEVLTGEDRISPIKSKDFIDKPNEKSILKESLGRD